MFRTCSSNLFLPIAAIAGVFLIASPASGSADFQISTTENSTAEPTAPPVAPRRRFLPYIQKSPFSPLRSSTTTPETASEPAPQQPSSGEPSDSKTDLSSPNNGLKQTQASVDSILPVSTLNTSVPATPEEQTYSIRLPLSTPGSKLPKIHSPAPSSPPSNTFLPGAKRAQTVDYKPPVAWRSTAEAIRNQPATVSLLVATVNADYKTVYTSVLQEASISGWSLVSDSVQAGHMLMKVPKPGDQDDAAAWLILVASPVDNACTEVRIKIQAKRPATYAPTANDFLQRLQLKATGNKLL